MIIILVKYIGSMTLLGVFPIIRVRDLCVIRGGVIHFDACHYDYVRPGILLYGIILPLTAQGDSLSVQPVMHFVSALIAVNVLPKGDPVGYGDGRPYHCCGAYVMVRGQQCPVIGSAVFASLFAGLCGGGCCDFVGQRFAC